MKPDRKLLMIKIIHTLVWLFFNVVIFYLLYAVIVNKIDWRVWTGYGLIAAEGLVLLIFKNICPITTAARRYSSSDKDNFDIFLPNWLASYNKLIYTAIAAVVIIITVYQLLK